MAKIKKRFLTMASAFCCIVCATLAILGLISKNTVRAENATTYETATVYDVSQLSKTGPTATMGDVSWIDGKDYVYDASFTYENLGYTLTSEGAPKSFGIQFAMQAKNDWTGDDSSFARLFINNTEIRWEFNDNGFRVEVVDWCESSPSNKVIAADKNKYLSATDFDKKALHTYKIVKSMKENSTTDYKVDVYIDGSLEYSAEVEGVTLLAGTSWLNKTIDKVLLRNKSAQSNTLTIKSAFTPANVDSAKDIYDYKQDEAYLMGKPFESKTGTNVDMIDKSGIADVSADSFGLTFKVKFDSTVSVNQDVIRARIGGTYDARLRVVTAGENGRAQINAFDWQNGTQPQILGATAYQFDIDFTQEHTYSFIKERIAQATQGYVYSAYVDGVLIQRAVYNVAPYQGDSFNSAARMRVIIQNGNHTGTFSSAKYYGVKVDGELNKVNVGESYTLVAPTTEKLFFGFKDAQNNAYKAGDAINSVKTLTSVVVGATNDESATVRMLHAGQVSLKWNTYINKAEYDALVALYGEENVSIWRKVEAENSSAKIEKEVSLADVVVGETEYSYSQLLSNIKEGNYTRKFAYSSYIKVVDGNGATLYEATIENDNEVSIAEVAEREYNLVSDEQTEVFKYQITDVEETDANYGKYSKYTTSQRTLLAQYIVA